MSRAAAEVLEVRYLPELARLALAIGRELPMQRALFDGVYLPDSRVCEIGWIYPDTNPKRELRNALLTVVDEVNARYCFALDDLGALQFTRYREGGHYEFHLDWHPTDPRSCRRKLSLTLNCSFPEEYGGGTFELHGPGPIRSVGLTFGTLIVFPSFLPHRIAPVTRGERISVVAWATGPPLV